MAVSEQAIYLQMLFVRLGEFKHRISHVCSQHSLWEAEEDRTDSSMDVPGGPYRGLHGGGFPGGSPGPGRVRSERRVGYGVRCPGRREDRNRGPSCGECCGSSGSVLACTAPGESHRVCEDSPEQFWVTPYCMWALSSGARDHSCRGPSPGPVLAAVEVLGPWKNIRTQSMHRMDLLQAQGCTSVFPEASV